MTIEQAKSIDLVDFLSRIGFHGQRKGKNVWYHSPLHDEKTPSFKVNTDRNQWYDFGNVDNNHGNLIDFGILYYHCSVADFLKELDKIYQGQWIKPTSTVKADNVKEDEPQIKILSEKPLQAFALLQYLKERNIPHAIAQQYCKEVTYELKGKVYYSVGFKNDSGGYALRNSRVKNASMPGDVTYINNRAKDLAVFEGFFDFLAYKALYHKTGEPTRNYLILNSTSFFTKSLPLMQEHSRVHLYLDNDGTGDKCVNIAQKLNAEKFQDERSLYKNHKDLNDFLVNFGKTQKPRIHQSL
jgi:hypothetical protein